MKVKVINRRGFLFLVGENNEDLGAQTNIKICNSTSDKGRVKVSVDFILDFEDIEMSEGLNTSIKGGYIANLEEWFRVNRHER